MRCTIIPHPEHARLFKITLDEEAVKKFLDETNDITEERLSNVPYLRSIAADYLQKAIGEAFAERINDIVRDRESGGFTLHPGCKLESMDQQVALGTAVSHLIGVPNSDDMSKNFYASFTLTDTYESDSYLKQAYRLLTLHTDGTYAKEPTDWTLLMKMDEMHASGGKSRLLHLDDWEDLDRFSQDPLASTPLTYKSAPGNNDRVNVEKSTFYLKEGRPCACFTDRFVYPDTIEQARFLKELSDSMEASPGVASLPLAPNHLVVLNNHFWLHGREAFQKHPRLHRVMMRQCGYFRD